MHPGSPHRQTAHKATHKSAGLLWPEHPRWQISLLHDDKQSGVVLSGFFLLRCHFFPAVGARPPKDKEEERNSYE